MKPDRGVSDIASPSSSEARLYLPTTRRHIWWATGGASAISVVIQLWVVFRTDEPLDFPSLVLAVFVLWCLIYLPLTWRALVMTDAASLARWAAVATTFGTTDVNVTSSRVRRVVLGHSLLSLAFITGVLALTVTLLFT